MLVHHDLSLVDEIAELGPAPRGRMLDHAGRPKKRNGNPEIMLVQRPMIKWARQVIPNSRTIALNTEQKGTARTKVERGRYGNALKISGMVTGFMDAVTLLQLGRTIWWEFKTPGGTVSAEQHERHTEAQQLGHVVIVCDGEESARYGLNASGIWWNEHDRLRQLMRLPRVYYEGIPAAEARARGLIA